MKKFHIVLIEPEIPQNTGNIMRTCAATGADLHLVKPLGFSLEDKYVRRSGLDYRKDCPISVYESTEEFFAAHVGARFWFFSTKAKQCYTDVEYKDGDFLVFGKESFGIREAILKEHYDKTVRIPMLGETRSLNLSNSANIALYEALRQGGFEGLNEEGALTGRKD